MANIEISELRPAGSELFQGSESFLNELTDQETWSVQGGILAGTLAGLLGLGGANPLISGNSGFNITGADSVGTLAGLLGP